MYAVKQSDSRQTTSSRPGTRRASRRATNKREKYGHAEYNLKWLRKTSAMNEEERSAEEYRVVASGKKND